VGVSGDYYFIDKAIAPKIGLGWYLGGGIYGNVGFWSDYVFLAAGGRLPIGLSWQPIDLIEVYLQAVPSIGVQILPPINLNWGIGVDLGIRFWF
jgi:hypothetical protein